MQPEFPVGELFGAIDYRDQPDNARAGGLLRPDLARAAPDLTSIATASARWTSRLQQFFPDPFDKKRVIAVQGRLRLAATAAATGQTRALSLLQADGRRQHQPARLQRLPLSRRRRAYVNLSPVPLGGASPVLDMALFSGLGHRRPDGRRAQAGPTLENAYGIGFRFNNYKSVFYPRRHRLRRRAGTTTSSSARRFEPEDADRDTDRCRHDWSRAGTVRGGRDRRC